MNSTDSPVPGFTGRAAWAILLAGIGLLYGLGWFYEDTRYWLDTRAVLIWSVALPLWLAAGGGLFRLAPLGGFLLGLTMGVVVLLVHTVVMTLVDGHFNDDHLGISALYGGACWLGWSLGWGIRRAVEKKP